MAIQLPIETDEYKGTSDIYSTLHTTQAGVCIELSFPIHHSP